jgi:preprotein translocase subunit SecB
MRTIESSLRLLDFVIVESQCTYNASDENAELMQIQNSYPVDIDFDIRQSTDKNNYCIEIFVSINEEKKEGYSIKVTGLGFFSIQDIEIEEEIEKLINYSAINICIANLRSYIANMTSYYPMGKYLFHSIDMPKLIKAKIQESTKIINSSDR